MEPESPFPSVNSLYTRLAAAFVVLGHSLNQEVVPFRGGTGYAARSCAEPSAVAKRSMLPRRLHNSKTLDDIMWTLNPKLFKEPLRNLNPPASVFELTVDLQLFRALLARPKPSFCRIRINFLCKVHIHSILGSP